MEHAESAAVPAQAAGSPGCDGEDQSSRLCPIVGIGASAGGLEAFRQLLSALPDKTGLAFVLIQHLDPAHESQLADLLSKATHLPVTEVTDGMAVEPDHVYIIPPNAVMAMEEGVLRLTPRDHTQGVPLPVDFFFRSLARECQSHAIGVVLSGTGADGSLGMAEIKAAGGITFAQDEDSAGYATMPQSAVAGGCVDFVLPPDQIARELAKIGQHAHFRLAPITQGEPEAQGDFDKILAGLRAATGVDFSDYRDTTIRRRITRRMALQKQESLSAYVRLLQANPTEIDALYRDILINVTSFFRDPEVFEALKTTVFPEIVTGKSPDNPIRIWVPGCSTGQEAYSLAMVLLEFLDQKAARPAIQIFGTDINDAAAVEKARPGVYPPTIEAEVSPERLRRFFTKVDHGYRIAQSIRDLCIFARQDVTSDPPFSRLDLISCRNLLIYLSPTLQSRIITTFNYALNAGGFLLLGPSETVGKFSALFEQVDRPHNIYFKTAPLSRPSSEHYPPVPPARGPAAPVERRPALVDLRREADRVLLGRFAPAAVLIDDNLEILQFRGQTSPYLQPPTGPPTHNILKMARDSLFLELRSVIDEARQRHTTARRRSVRVQDGQEVRLVDLEATPLRLHGAPQRCYLILFTEDSAPKAVATGDRVDAAPLVPLSPADAHENAELRQELASVKEYLQAIIEQQNAANEELQSANEEIRSANEELQSANEEMQTAKEELQSTNEELRTVNDELQARNQEISRINDDFANTLSSIKLPIVMLSSDLRIRRFTSTAGTLLNLIATDIGRPLGDIRPAFDVPNLSEMLLEVIAEVCNKEQEIADRHGRWHLLTMHPYRSGDHRIDGVVLVLRDIDAEKRTRERLVEVSQAKDRFLAVLSHELRTPLTPVLATVAMLQQQDHFDADTREQLEVIRRNAELEARLVDDLLDVTRITRGKVELDKRPIDLSEVIRQAVDVCKPDIETRRLEFGVDAEGTPYGVEADATRLQQVFWNLLKNAIKFTPVGGCVGIRCRRNGDGFVTVEVSDSGVGIKPEVIGHIFRAFEQGGVGVTRQFGGLGLGLVISKGIVELHGGTIEARSAGEGKGATFTVRLPLLPAQAANPAAAAGSEATPPNIPTRPVRILLVEDHGDTATIMKRLLSADGHEVQIAADIATALRVATAEPFDLLLSDLGLPDGSGLDLLRELRTRGITVPGVALSGYGQEHDMQQSREAGFVAHLVKPVSLTKLAEVIAKAVGQGSSLAVDKSSAE